MALSLFTSAKSLLKIDELTIDNIVFKLHYRVSVALLLGSSLIGVAKQYFGDPINCQTSSGVSSKVLDDYCWIHSTFHVRNEYQGNIGCIVDPELTIERNRVGDSGYYLNYSSQLSADTPDTSFYQWVPFILIFQAALVYIPRKIWKTCEGGLIASFGKDARQLVILKGDMENVGDKGCLIKEDIARKYIAYFHSILHHNNGYFGLFFLCEVLNLVIDVINIYLTDFFLSGRFMKYGSQVVKYLGHNKYDRLTRPNPMCTVFPTVTRLLTIFLPPMRRLLIILKIRGFSNSDMATCKSVLSHCYLGDWFVLYQLSKNSNTYFFRYLLKIMDSSFTSQAKSRYFTVSRSHIPPPLPKVSDEYKKRKPNGGSEDGTNL